MNIQEIRDNFLKRLNETTYNFNLLPVKVGEMVEIPFNLTTDPINKQGEEGEVKFIDEQGVVYVKFKDGMIGGYDINTFSIGVNEEIEDEDIEKTKELTNAIKDLSNAKEEAGLEEN